MAQVFDRKWVNANVQKETGLKIETVMIKKLCDGFEITLGEFFSTPEFDSLE